MCPAMYIKGRKEGGREGEELEIKGNNVVPYCVFPYYSYNLYTLQAQYLSRINQCSFAGMGRDQMVFTDLA